MQRKKTLATVRLCGEPPSPESAWSETLFTSADAPQQRSWRVSQPTVSLLTGLAPTQINDLALLQCCLAFPIKSTFCNTNLHNYKGYYKAQSSFTVESLYTLLIARSFTPPHYTWTLLLLTRSFVSTLSSSSSHRASSTGGSCCCLCCRKVSNLRY